MRTRFPNSVHLFGFDECLNTDTCMYDAEKYKNTLRLISSHVNPWSLKPFEWPIDQKIWKEFENARTRISPCRDAIPDPR